MTVMSRRFFSLATKLRAVCGANFTVFAACAGLRLVDVTVMLPPVVPGTAATPPAPGDVCSASAWTAWLWMVSARLTTSPPLPPDVETTSVPDASYSLGRLKDHAAAAPTTIAVTRMITQARRLRMPR